MPAAKPEKFNQLTDNFLNAKQQIFVKAYLADYNMNAAAAAKEAGLSVGVLNNPAVRKEIDAQIRRRLQGYELTKERILQELLSLAFSNIKHMLNPVTGRMYALHEMPDHVAASIRSITVRSTVSEDIHGNEVQVQDTSINFWEKSGALLLLYKHMGLDVSSNPYRETEAAEAAAEQLLPLLLQKVEQARLTSSNVVNDEAIEKMA